MNLLAQSLILAVKILMNHVPSSSFSHKSTPADHQLAEKLKRDNATLAEAIKRLRAEAEEVARREGEAAEQVKSSVQVAEALRMEKTELEYEVHKEKKYRNDVSD